MNPFRLTRMKSHPCLSTAVHSRVILKTTNTASSRWNAARRQRRAVLRSAPHGRGRHRNGQILCLPGPGGDLCHTEQYPGGYLDQHDQPAGPTDSTRPAHAGAPARFARRGAQGAQQLPLPAPPGERAPTRAGQRGRAAGAVQSPGLADQQLGGDRNEINLNGPVERDMWMRVSAEDEACKAEVCMERTGGACPFYRARQAAQNSHLLLSTTPSCWRMSPRAAKSCPSTIYLIIDEAHHIEAATTSALSYRATQSDLIRLLREMGGSSAGILSRMLRQMQETAAAPDSGCFSPADRPSHRPALPAGTRLPGLLPLHRRFSGRMPRRQAGGRLRAAGAHPRFQPHPARLDRGRNRLGYRPRSRHPPAQPAGRGI